MEVVVGALVVSTVVVVVRALRKQPEGFSSEVLGFAPPPRQATRSENHNTGTPGDDDYSVTIAPKQLSGGRRALPSPKPLALPPAVCPACGAERASGAPALCPSCGGAQ